MRVLEERWLWKGRIECWCVGVRSGVPNLIQFASYFSNDGVKKISLYPPTLTSHILGKQVLHTPPFKNAILWGVLKRCIVFWKIFRDIIFPTNFTFLPEHKYNLHKIWYFWYFFYFDDGTEDVWQMKHFCLNTSIIYTKYSTFLIFLFRWWDRRYPQIHKCPGYLFHVFSLWPI